MGQFEFASLNKSKRFKRKHAKGKEKHAKKGFSGFTLWVLLCGLSLPDMALPPLRKRFTLLLSPFKTERVAPTVS
jgi:hypothetical protein